MKRLWLRGTIACAVVAGAILLGSMQLSSQRSLADSTPSARPVWPGSDDRVAFSAPGVTEPSSRTLQIYSEMPGTISTVHVRSGDRITIGQILFELADDTQRAEVRHREALVRTAKANLAKIESWERDEDRRIAKAVWDETQALLEIADYEKQRVDSVGDAATATERLTTTENLQAARSRAEAAKAQYDRSTAGPRPEDIEVARSAVLEAEAQLAVAMSYLEKTKIRSPIDGIVVYRFREPGEAVVPEIPQPIVSVGDRSTLHIRADVDEMDIGRVQLGQRVFATADAFDGKRFEGTVVHIEQTLGRKNFRTFRPTEKADTKILEVVIALDYGHELPIELQMTIWFLHPDPKEIQSSSTRPAKDGLN